jgi:hypothetical protein
MLTIERVREIIIACKSMISSENVSKEGKDFAKSKLNEMYKHLSLYEKTTEEKLKDEIEIIRTKGCPQCICENSKDKYVENCEDCLLRIGYLRGKLKGYQQARDEIRKKIEEIIDDRIARNENMLTPNIDIVEIKNGQLRNIKQEILNTLGEKQ